MYEAIREQYDEDPNRLLSRQAAADLLGLRPCTLAAWASMRKTGLPYVRIGGRARYRLADVRAFIDSNVVEADQA